MNANLNRSLWRNDVLLKHIQDFIAGKLALRLKKVIIHD